MQINPIQLKQLIEASLFVLGKPLSVKMLKETVLADFSVSRDKIKAAKPTRSAVVPSGPITGNKVLAKDAPDWITTIATRTLAMAHQNEALRLCGIRFS